jgi:hypothetical protein
MRWLEARICTRPYPIYSASAVTDIDLTSFETTTEYLKVEGVNPGSSFPCDNAKCFRLGPWTLPVSRA